MDSNFNESSCQNNFVNLILNNFSYYYFLFFDLKDNQAIEMVSYINYPQGYFSYENPEKYNLIITLSGNDFEQIKNPSFFINKIFSNKFDNILLVYAKLGIQNFRNLEKNYDYIEIWRNQIKVRIKYESWIKIIVKFFSSSKKNNFVFEVYKILWLFPYNTWPSNAHLLNLANLITNHFSYYYYLFLDLGIDQSIFITSFRNYPNGYWYEEDPSYYNWVEGMITDEEQALKVREIKKLKLIEKEFESNDDINNIIIYDDTIYATFLPDFWSEILKVTTFDNYYFFHVWFFDIVNDNVNSNSKHLVNLSSSIDELLIRFLTRTIFNNSKEYYKIWQKSTKDKKVKIACLINQDKIDKNSSFKEFQILQEDKKYLNPLAKYFDEKNDYSNNIFLGLIKNNDIEEIKKIIGKMNFPLKFKEIRFKNIGKDILNENYFIEVEAIVDENKDLKNKNSLNFYFLNQKFLTSDLLNILQNNSLIQKWGIDFLQWIKEIKRQQTEDIIFYNKEDEQSKSFKRIWYGNNVLEFSSKLLNLSNILQLKSLDEELKNSKKNLESLKEFISNINLNLSDIKSEFEDKMPKDLLELRVCTTIGAIISLIFSITLKVSHNIPEIIGILAALCDVANLLYDAFA